MRVGVNYKNTPESSCPSCGYKVDSASGAGRAADHQPSPGDLTVCLRCASINEFDDEMHVRTVSVERQFEMLLDPVVGPELNKVIDAIRRLKW